MARFHEKLILFVVNSLFVVAPIMCRGCLWSLLCNLALGILSSYQSIIFLKKRKIAGCFTFHCDGLCSVSLPHDDVG